MKQIVIGLGFGDEGKGLTTEYLVSKAVNPLVIRFTGGGQAGHTVYHENFHHVFSNFGSGSYLRAPTYWSSVCPIEPIGIMNEYDILIEKGITPILYIDRNCPIVTPFDKLYNQTVDQVNGTVGVGIGPTLKREESLYSLVFSDLLYHDVAVEKFNQISNYYNLPVEYKKIDEFWKACQFVLSNFSMVDGIQEASAGYTDLIFEGSQGLMLDKNIGFFPHVTRSCVSTKYLSNGGDYYLVTRAYQTRHGNGPMMNPEYPLYNEFETNKSAGFQGKFRTAHLNLDMLMYAMDKDEKIRKAENLTLVITCLDVIKEQWFLYFNGEKIKFNSEEKFVNFVASTLGIDNILVSHSPYSDQLKLVKNT